LPGTLPELFNFDPLLVPALLALAIGDIACVHTYGGRVERIDQTLAATRTGPQ
jgi:hypothetical protein